MELEAPKCPWIASKHFNANNVLSGTIAAVRAEKGKFGIDYIVEIKPIETLENVQMTVWGSNYNFLYNTYGNKPEQWIGKPIIVTETKDANGKPRRVVSR